METAGSQIARVLRWVNTLGAVSSIIALALMIWLEWTHLQQLFHILLKALICLGIVLVGFGVPSFIILGGFWYAQLIADQERIPRSDAEVFGLILSSVPLLLYGLFLNWLMHF